MENSIIIPDNRFDFSKLRLLEPVSIQGGTYFTKLYNGNESLYIQTPKGTTKQGFIKSSRKIHNDLLFNNGDEHFIQWILDLESKCIELLYNYSADWFQSPLEMADIENAFNTILKVNKTNGYVIRSNVKIHTMTKQPVIKVYNQSETPMTMDNVTKDTNVITIMEIQGIKFTSKSFQLETELKQVMVLDKDIFDNCLIKPILQPTSHSLAQINESSSIPRLVEESINVSNDETETESEISEVNSTKLSIPEISLTNEPIDDQEPSQDLNLDLESSSIQELSLEVDHKTKDSQNQNHVEFVDLASSSEQTPVEEEPVISPLNLDITEVTDLNEEEEKELYDDSDEEDTLPKLTFGEDTTLSNIESIQTLGGPQDNQNLEEISYEAPPTQQKEENAKDLVESILDEVIHQGANTDELQDFTDKDLDVSDEIMKLNKPEQHYYELFEKVRNEAKEAKKRAKEAYLKAKNIKKSYMLETMSESSDDSLDSLDESDEETELNLE